MAPSIKIFKACRRTFFDRRPSRLIAASLGNRDPTSALVRQKRPPSNSPGMEVRNGLLTLFLGSLAALALACTPISHATDQVVIMQTEAPRSMDPEDHTATYTRGVLDPIYEGLTRFNDRLQIEPELATEWTPRAKATE